jgi:Fur family transcriptional regulator, peroxide stress response regulator
VKIKPKEIENRVRTFSERCRGYGLKATHQRAEIYREIARTDEHPDAETIYARVRKRLPTLSLDTVYRTLRLLERKGIILRAGLLSERARFDANTVRHHHFVCSECGFMGDLYNEEWNDFRVPEDVVTMGTVNSIHVELRGLCRACQRKRQNKGMEHTFLQEGER